MLLRRFRTHRPVPAGDGTVSTNRTRFTNEFIEAATAAGLRLKPALAKAIANQLSERDEDGELQTCRANQPEADSDTAGHHTSPGTQEYHQYLDREVKPSVPDACIMSPEPGRVDSFTRHFDQYVPPRPLEEIDRDLDEVRPHSRAAGGGQEVIGLDAARHPPDGPLPPLMRFPKWSSAGDKRNTTINSAVPVQLYRCVLPR
ncbi:hypothetical protein QJS66_19300 [Kocuria rhizophila]|nr:hypothetical protein QJS66_19300 [Kocuria rhizophila]